MYAACRVQRCPGAVISHRGWVIGNGMRHMDNWRAAQAGSRIPSLVSRRKDPAARAPYMVGGYSHETSVLILAHEVATPDGAGTRAGALARIPAGISGYVRSLMS